MFASSLEAEEIGAVGAIGMAGIPEIVELPDIAGMEHEHAPAVEDPKLVDWILPQLDEVHHLPAVVDTVTVGGDQVGEVEQRGGDGDGVASGVGASEGEWRKGVGWQKTIDDACHERDVEVAARQVAVPAVEGFAVGECVEGAVGAGDEPLPTAAVGLAVVDELYLGVEVGRMLGVPCEGGRRRGQDDDGQKQRVVAAAIIVDDKREHGMNNAVDRREGEVGLLCGDRNAVEHPMPPIGTTGGVDDAERAVGAEHSGQRVERQKGLPV